MPTLTLPAIMDPGANVLAFTPGTYVDLVNNVLGNTALDGDDVDLATQNLAALIDAYEKDVTAGLAAEALPDLQGLPFDLSIDDAVLAELATADAVEIGLNAGLGALVDGLGAWGDLYAFYDLWGYTVAYTENQIGDLYDDVVSIENTIGDYGYGFTCNPFTQGGC